MGRGAFITRLRLRLVASEASHITDEVFGEMRAVGSSLARPRADFLVLSENFQPNHRPPLGFRPVVFPSFHRRKHGRRRKDTNVQVDIDVPIRSKQHVSSSGRKISNSK